MKIEECDAQHGEWWVGLGEGLELDVCTTSYIINDKNYELFLWACFLNNVEVNFLCIL